MKSLLDQDVQNKIDKMEDKNKLELQKKEQQLGKVNHDTLKEEM